MATARGAGADQLVADLGRELSERAVVELAQVLGTRDVLEMTHRPHCSFRGCVVADRNI